MKFLPRLFSWHLVVILTTASFIGGTRYGETKVPETPPPQVYVLDSETVKYARQYKTSYFISETILENAREYRIPKTIAFRLVWAESRFNPRAVSSANALGLAQVLHSTAVGMDSTVTREELFEPDRNVDLGFRYLRLMRIRYHGDWHKALMAYNMGPRFADTTTQTEHTYADYILQR